MIKLTSRMRRVFSQGGEEGVLEAIFEHVGAPTQFFVDIGAGVDHGNSNTHLFATQGWKGECFDARPSSFAHLAKFNAENACALLAEQQVPIEFDLLALDIDGIDWWVLAAILKQYRPRVVIAEFNGALDMDPPLTVPNDPNWEWAGNSHYGASLGAFRVLAEARGYVLLYQFCAVNCFLVRADLMPEGWHPDLVEFATCPSHPAGPRDAPWHTITEDDLR